MAFMRKLRGNQASVDASNNEYPTANTVNGPHDTEKQLNQPRASVADDGPVHIFTLRVVAMGIIVSMGGFIFGYDTG